MSVEYCPCCKAGEFKTYREELYVEDEFLADSRECKNCGHTEEVI